MSDLTTSGLAPIRMVEAYWEGLRSGRLLPNRGEVQARGLGAAMENAFILERVKNGFARLRVSGSQLNDLRGMETRGMPISAFFEKDDLSRLSDVLETVFSEPAGVHLTLRSPASHGAPVLNGAMILLPLRSDLGDVTRALGCLVFEGLIGKPPRNFRIVTEERNSLTGFAEPPVQPDARPRRTDKSGVTGFSEDKTPFEPHRPTRRQQSERPHLRLVKSDRDPVGPDE